MDDLADRLLLPAKLLLALLIAWILADGVWFLLGSAETELREPPSVSTTVATNERRVATAAEIAALELFGRADQAEVAAVDAPETRLQLELHGVFLAAAEEDSSAIVAERNRQGKLVFVGERMPGNAELVRVLQDRIVLRRGGTLETLRFPEPGVASGFAATPGTDGQASTDFSQLPNGGSQAAVSSGAGSPRRAQPAPRPGPSAESGTPGPSVRDLVSSYRARLESDPDGAMRELGVEAVQIGDSQGYRVGNQASAADLARVGLRPGDVVLSVNGRGVQELQQDSAALEGILDAGTARLEIQRGERRFFVTTRIPRQ